MDICDENGNLCEGFLTRLEKLKNQQAENVRRSVRYYEKIYILFGQALVEF